MFKRQKHSVGLDLTVVLGNSCQPRASLVLWEGPLQGVFPSIATWCFHSLLKIAVQPPQGLKSNLLQMFGYGGSGEVTEEIFGKNDCGPWWKKILFSLCFFNAVINERKVYGTLGWNAPYKFRSSDLEVSVGHQRRKLS